VALSDPVFESARVVFRLPHASLRRPDEDDRFIQAVRGAFPILATRQALPMDVNAPYIQLQSTASRLALSSGGSEFGVNFYADFGQDIARCFAYVRDKTIATLRGWEAVGVPPTFVGIICVLNYPFGQDKAEPAAYLLSRHTKYDVDAALVQDAFVRVALKIEEHYYLSLGLAVYERRAIERAVVLGQQVQVKPWEGEVDVTGIELTVDVNDRLYALANREEPTVDDAEVEAVLGLAEAAVARAGSSYIESARLDVDELTGVQA
jgi:hypothetical protein